MQHIEKDSVIWLIKETRFGDQQARQIKSNNNPNHVLDIYQLQDVVEQPNQSLSAERIQHSAGTAKNSVS